MGRPRKSTTSKSTTNKVNISEQSTTTNNQVKFVAGTQSQYNNKKKTTNTQTEVVTNVKEETRVTRYLMGKIEPTTKPRKTHVVQWGESIHSIPGLYSVPVMKLIKLNGTNNVSVGQTIYID